MLSYLASYSDKKSLVENEVLFEALRFIRSKSKVVDFACGVGDPFDKFLVEDLGCLVDGVDNSELYLKKMSGL